MTQESYLNILINNIEKNNPEFKDNYKKYINKQSGGNNVLKIITEKFFSPYQDGGSINLLHNINKQKINLQDFLPKDKILPMYPVCTKIFSQILKDVNVSDKYDINFEVIDDLLLSISNKKNNLTMLHYYNQLVLDKMRNNTDFYKQESDNKIYLLSSSIPFRMGNLQYGKLDRNLYIKTNVSLSRDINLDHIDKKISYEIISKDLFIKPIENNKNNNYYLDIFYFLINFMIMSILSCKEHLYLPDFDYIHNKLDVITLSYIYILAYKYVKSIDFEVDYKDSITDSNRKFIDKVINKRIDIKIYIYSVCPRFKEIFEAFYALIKKDNMENIQLHNIGFKIAKQYGLTTNIESLLLNLYHVKIKKRRKT